MPVPDLDHTIRSLHLAANGAVSWDTVLSALRESLGAADLRLSLGPVASGMADGLQITWPSDRSPEGEQCAWLVRLHPHVLAAVRTARRFSQTHAHASLCGLLLDGLPHPCWLLHAGGGIVAENAAGRAERACGRWLSAGTPLLGASSLLLRSAADQRAFDAAVAAAVNGRPVQVPLESPAGVDSEPARCLLRRLRPSTAAAQPLAAGTATWPGADALVLVSLVLPGQAAALDAAALARAFGLTPAESRVAVCLSRGRTAREIAVELGVAPTTVRSHLKQVLVKLGVARKLDAVRLLAQGGWFWRPAQQPGASNA